LRIIGIDPGIAIAGFGIVERQADRVKVVQYGSIETPAGEDPGQRLRMIYDAACGLIDRYEPKEMAVEKLFFNRNVTTAFTVGQARGVIMLAAVQKGLSIAEYTPLQVKQAVAGYGKAEKRQVQEMVKLLLGLPDIPKPDDVADALAVAICHAHAGTLNGKLREMFRS
jgi:crossover junction endodeoxyribonuclease RuvC